MRLTNNQMVELNTIEFRVMTLHSAAIVNPPTSFILVQSNHGDELQDYKIKLENMFSATDLKNEKVDILTALIDIEQLISDAESDDFERYNNMGLKIAPNAAKFYFGNGNI